MNDEVSKPQAQVYSPVSSIAIAGGAGEAGAEASGMAFKGGQAIGDGLKGRLTELTEWAITSRSLARQYFRTARRFVAAARQARRESDQWYYHAHLEEARKAHEQARKCLSFSRLCHKRAECLAIIGDYPRNLGA